VINVLGKEKHSNIKTENRAMRKENAKYAHNEIVFVKILVKYTKVPDWLIKQIRINGISVWKDETYYKESEEINMQIANKFNDFIEKVSEAERTALNSPAGQELTQKLLEMKLKKNRKCPQKNGKIQNYSL